MRFILSALFMLMCLSCFSQGSTPAPVAFNYQRDFRMILDKTKDKGSDLYYQKLLIRFLNNDSSLTRAETLALMIGFTEERNYKPLKNIAAEQEIFDLNEEGDYEEALALSKTYLQKNPLSLRILKERSYSYHQLRKRDSAEFFMNQVEKIMNAMIYSGKGKTPETAIFSLGLIDGEHFINNVGMTPANKTTTSPKSKVLMYIVDAMNDEGVHINYYFNIQHARDKFDEEELDEDQPVVKTQKSKKDKKEKDKKEKESKGKDKETKGKEKKDKGRKDKWEKDETPVPPVTDSIPASKPVVDTLAPVPSK